MIAVREFTSGADVLAHARQVAASRYRPRQIIPAQPVAPSQEAAVPVETLKREQVFPNVADLLARFISIHVPEHRPSPQDALYPNRQARRILAAAAEKHGVTPEAILGDSKRRHLVDARHDAWMLVAKANPGWSLPRLGAFFNRDHTSILHALRKMGVER